MDLPGNTDELLGRALRRRVGSVALITFAIVCAGLALYFAMAGE